MPPRDVGALVMRDGGAELDASSRGCETAPSPDTDRDPYAPAESLRLRIGEDIDWSDVGAAAVAVLERDDSTKGAAANPKRAARRTAAATRTSLSSAPAPAPAPAPAVAVVIGGLPPGKAAAARDHGRRGRSPCQQLQLGLGERARVFASGEAAVSGRPHQADAEPGSPKVSCLGGVRSQLQPRTAPEGIASGGRRWWACLVADVMFCCCCRKGRCDRRPTASEAE